jgi:hypothetical protein
MLINHNLIPEEFDEQKKVYNWVKYIRKSRYKLFYKLDERALVFYEKNLNQSKLINDTVDGEYLTLVDSSYVDKYYENQMLKIKAYITSNQVTLLNRLNHELFMEQWEKYGMDNIAQGEMQSMRMYVHDHELSDVSLPYEISDFATMPEAESDGNFFIDGKIIPRYLIRHIVGTVIDKSKLKHKITVLTPTGPADVKIWKNQFAMYDQTLTDVNAAEKTVIQDSFFEIGTHLMLTGVKRVNTFMLKKYKNTKIDDVILKINIKEDEFSDLESKAKAEGADS